MVSFITSSKTNPSFSGSHVLGRSTFTLLLLTMLCACTNLPANHGQALQAKPDQNNDYSFTRWIASRGSLDENLVILSFSGGGVRAATLAAGVLDELKANRLDSHIGLISSTSGGSLAAGVYATAGSAGIMTMTDAFLSNKNMGPIAKKLAPVFFVPGANRASLFADYLDHNVLERNLGTYGDLVKRWPESPFVILNATNMSTGSTFEFTQENFSTICSDLSKFRLSHAIAASASFPLALNPLPLRNHWDASDCDDFVSGEKVEKVLADATRGKYLSPYELERARHLHALKMTYVQDDDNERKISYIHLLDGGLSDNLAARAIVRELGRNIDQLKAAGVRRILLVQVDAKTPPINTYDNSGSIPSPKDVIGAITMGPIDMTTHLSAYVSQLYLVQLMKHHRRDPDDANAILIYPAYVEFSLIDDKADRDRARKIKTSWSLPNSSGRDNDVEFLKRMATEILRSNPCYQHFSLRANMRKRQDVESDREDCEFLKLAENSDSWNLSPTQAPAPALPPVPTSEKLSLGVSVLFDFGIDQLGEDSRRDLADLVQKVRDVNLEVIIAIGHADAIGSDKENADLSTRRAEAVRHYLVEQGIEPSRIYVEGKGESEPAADNQTAEGRARNRRVEVEVVGTRRAR